MMIPGYGEYTAGKSTSGYHATLIYKRQAFVF